MKIEAFSKTYLGRTVLQFPGGEFERGTVYAVLGPNGSGKSTFVQVAAGIIQSDQKTPALENEAIGYLPQSPYAFHRSLMNNLLLGGEGSAAEKKERARKLMDALSLTPLASENAASLSGGETAKMALARQLMKPYSVLILDEPCAAMDMRSVLKAEDLIREYVKETNCTLILITHSVKQAERLSEEILFLYDGHLLERGKTEQLLYYPVSIELQEFLEL